MDLDKHDTVLYIIANIIIVASCLLGITFSIISFLRVKKTPLKLHEAGDSVSSPAIDEEGGIKSLESKRSLSGKDVEVSSEESISIFRSSDDYKIFDVYQKIRDGAFTFLRTEFFFFIPFLILFDSFLILSIGLRSGFLSGVLSGLCFLTGSVTSLFCGALGMSIATFANARTTVSAKKSLKKAFTTSFTAAQCFGILLPSIGVLVVYLTIHILILHYKGKTYLMYIIFSSFGLGGSTAGTMSRTSGGIFTKVADMAADNVGKNEQGLEEDDPRNPAVIADNVGDNVGDIAGMGSDLFGSFSETVSCAFITIANSKTLSSYNSPQFFPLVYLAIAVDVAILTSFFATYLYKPKLPSDVEGTLKGQILIFAILMLITSVFICYMFLPSTFNVSKAELTPRDVRPQDAFCCLAIGIVGGALVGIMTEFYTSASYSPVQNLALSSEAGAGTLIIFGLALGQLSTIIPVVILGVMMYVGYLMAEFFGVVMIALGLLSFTGIILTIDAYGPICDNAGGIAEMAGLGEDVRKRTDALDSAGNTTAAIGKGFAICLAYIVGMALQTSFVRISNLQVVNMISPFPLFGLLIGACIPSVYSALLLSAVGKATKTMTEEIRRQFANGKILKGEEEPDYAECIAVATRASLYQSIPPFLLTLLPILIGMLLGKKALTGFIVGVQISGVPLAISSNNSGGAWDNAKKYIESGKLGEGKGKHSDCHRNAVIGDTVGDPMKDTSGPSINTLLKVVAIISVVLANVFPKEGYLEKVIS